MTSHSILVILMMIPVSFADNCPSSNPNLQSWSTLNAGAGDIVKIDKGILLDKNLGGIELGGIVIEKDGLLVFSPDVDERIIVKTPYIHIKDGGRMDVGSEDCRYKAKLTIQLLGDRNPGYTLPDLGDKIIGVASGGLLNIFGEKKTSWSTMTETLPEMPKEGKSFSRTVTQDEAMQGFIVYQFDPTKKDKFDESDVKEKAFNFKTKSQKNFEATVDELEKYLEEVPDQYVVVAAIRKSLMADGDLKKFYSLFKVVEEFLQLKEGESKMHTLKYYDGYVMLKQKGSNVKGIEETSEYRLNGLHQLCELTAFIGDLKFHAVSYTRIKAHGQSYIDVEVTLRKYSEPILKVKTHNWNKGDRLVIAPTSGLEQHEYATVTEVIDSTQVKVDLTAKYDHLCTSKNGVLRCAEVALLSRNVLIEGLTLGADLYGGNIKCLKDFAGCFFADFELNLMGQQQPIGRYPVHFHLGGDVKGRALVDSLSIHNSYARCVAVHRTNNLIIRNTVCFDCLGHAFFLEDGDEIGNILRNNLAMLQRKPKGDNLLIPSDKKPNGFHITHPNNEFEGNVAVASEGNGFHYVFPAQPIGDSDPLNNFVEGEASRTNIKLFKGNTAHNNKEFGLRMDDYLDSLGNVKMNNGFNARSDPRDSTSELVQTELSCFTAYGNGEGNAHIRAAQLLLTNFAVGQSKTGISLLRGLRNGGYEQKVQKSVILGERESASSFVDNTDKNPRVGLEFVGPVTLEDLYFDDFHPTPVYRSGALGFVGGNSENIIQNRIENVNFGFDDSVAGNRMLEPDTDNDKQGNLVESFVGDGSVADSNSASTILRGVGFQTTKDCFIRTNWVKYAVCNEKYAMMSLNKPATIQRVDYEGNVLTLDTEGDMSPKNTPFNAVVDNWQYHYLFRFDNDDFKSAVSLRTYGSNKGSNAIVGCCVPKGADLRIQYDKNNVFGTVASYGDLTNTNSGNKYYHDVTEGIVFLNVAGREENVDDETFCRDEYKKNGICRNIMIKVKNGVTGINDCDVQKYTPPSPPTAKRQLVSETQKTSKSNEKRLLYLLKKLVDLESKKSGQSAETLKRKRRSTTNPNRVFPAFSGNVPDVYAACSI
ncbi:cell migration-inducing and hyaluronan-binding protein-like [Pecten maximus]|uniref:cell migration-inducing and hyaluronan-binding protein-like n=1 Tax=Pecten maximus TaxID=6579 RepID=UPI001458F1B8|nr:cell migration-inducing and hyaluronan-binding protein-like [Pecten maximus]